MHTVSLYKLENKQKSHTKLLMYPISYIKVLQNATKVDIDLGPYILVLDLVHVRSQKALVDISWHILR